MPQGATVVDFAYQIHSAVGNKMVGARVNGRIVPLDTVLENADQVEIMTSQNSKGPSADWLNIARTSQARNKINQWFRKEQKQENVTKGKELIERYIKMKQLPEARELLVPEWMEIVQRKYGFRDWNSVLAAIGFGGLKEGQVVNRLYEEYKKKQSKEISNEELSERINEQAASSQQAHEAKVQKGKSAIIVKGLSDVAVRFARCCNPVPGDEIIGYVTRGRGVSIHRTDCPNIVNMPEFERARLLESEWAGRNSESDTFVSSLQLVTTDKKGLLMEISTVISHLDINIHSLNTKRTKDGNDNIFMISVEISDRSQLEQLVNKLQQVNGVYEVIRT